MTIWTAGNEQQVCHNLSIPTRCLLIRYSSCGKCFGKPLMLNWTSPRLTQIGVSRLSTQHHVQLMQMADKEHPRPSVREIEHQRRRLTLIRAVQPHSPDLEPEDNVSATQQSPVDQPLIDVTSSSASRSSSVASATIQIRSRNEIVNGIGGTSRGRSVFSHVEIPAPTRHPAPARAAQHRT